MVLYKSDYRFQLKRLIGVQFLLSLSALITCKTKKGKDKEWLVPPTYIQTYVCHILVILTPVQKGAVAHVSTASNCRETQRLRSTHSRCTVSQSVSQSEEPVGRHADLPDSFLRFACASGPSDDGECVQI